jgi:HNH endonuclease
VIVYRGVTYKRNPNGKQRSHRVYYCAPRGSGHDSLHRDIWRDNHPGEEIPRGWHIHHADEDPFNNDPSNLVLRSPKDHRAEHPGDCKPPEGHLEAIRLLAAEWHRSAEGHDWHVENGKKVWEGRAPQYRKVCEGCGQRFSSYFERAKCCSEACLARVVRRENRYKRRVPCPICGAEFWQDKYRPTPQTCSRACGQELRRRAA